MDSVLSFEEIEAIFKRDGHKPIEFARNIESATLQRLASLQPAQPEQAAPSVSEEFRIEMRLPAGLHRDTQDLVISFAEAMAAKLHKAEQKYGYSNAWRDAGWMDECRQHLINHLAKGDPRDVANYCAFLWWHNEKTASPLPQSALSTDAQKVRDEDHIEDVLDMVSKAMRRAWQLGETFWMQADSESYSQNKKSRDTEAKFELLVDETREVIRAIQSQSLPSSTGKDAESLIESMRAFADAEYVAGCRAADRYECKGWEAKVRSGQFGQAEMDAHAKMNRHFGAHNGIHEAIRAAIAQKENDRGL